MISCIIVAGGKSSRMGMDKKFVSFKGKTFLEHATDVASKIASEIIIVVGSTEQEKQTKKITNLRVVVDEEQEKGPLMGILSGLRMCKGEYAVVMPIDTPLMKPEVFKKMLKEAKDTDAVLPQENEHIDPLHAVYKVKAMIEAGKKALKNGKYSVQSAARSLKNIKLIPLKEFREYDKDLLTFRSINTPEDLEELDA